MAEYQIIYSREVVDRLVDVLDYLEHKWTMKVADHFAFTFFSRIEELKQNPKIGRLSLKDKNIRSIIITRHNQLYYKYNDQNITLASLIDTRQHPSKNKFE